MKKKKKPSIKKLRQARAENPLTCGKCKLWNKREGVCGVTIMDKGERLELQTKAGDKCKWEEMGIEVHRMRAYSDGKNGYLEYTEDEKTTRGVQPHDGFLGMWLDPKKS